MRLGDALLSRNWIEPRRYYETFAQNFDLPFVDLIREPPDRSSAASRRRRYLYQPLDHAVAATRRPADSSPPPSRDRKRCCSRAAAGAPISSLSSSPNSTSCSRCRRAFADALSQRAVFELAELDPQMSARTVFTTPQMIVAYGLLSAVLAGLAFAPLDTLIVAQHRGQPVLSRQFRLQGRSGLGRRRPFRRLSTKPSRSRRARCAPRSCRYSRFWCRCSARRRCCRSSRSRCANSTIRSASSTSRSSWRRSDLETIEAARALGLEGVFEIIIVPRVAAADQAEGLQLRAALRARRISGGLRRRGSARARPVRKVVATFRRSPPNTACLQCRLNYYNANENWLTRMFTLDYALWFDQVLPGLERLGMPIPLGGTSNHFRIDVLRELHAWDPVQRHRGCRSRYSHRAKGLSRRRGQFDHVTRRRAARPASGCASARAGSRATCRRFWCTPAGRCTSCAAPDRSAFLASSSSSAARCWRDCSIRCSGCSIVIWLVAAAANLDVIFPQSLLLLCLFNLLAGNGAFTYLIMLAPIRRGWLGLIPFSFTLFGYWVLISVAAYRALWQLLRRSVLLGKDPARLVAARSGAKLPTAGGVS